jgi:site-specific DNA recombinase
MSAVIYCRISKDTEDKGLGVQRQERLCRELAERDGIAVLDQALVDNDISAYDRRRKRPAFEQLVDMLRRGAVDGVVTYHIDRLYRRTTDLERLVDIVESTGATVRTVSAGNVDLGTASGRGIARMLGAAAQMEVERLGERVAAKHHELAMKGSAPGGRPPYGYTRAIDADGRARGTYLVNPAEAAVVRRMADRILEGASLLKVARELTADGIPSREGRPWHHSTVRATLINPAIVGLRVHRREIAGPGDWTPVLDRATWEAVGAVLKDPARKRTRPARKYLLTGLVFSAEDDLMVGRPDRGGSGSTERRTYATRSPAVLSAAVDADALEGAITAAVLAALDGQPLPTPATRTPAEVDDIESVEAELAELAQLRGEGTISLAEWLAAREPLQRRLEEARSRASSHRQTPTKLLDLAAPGAVRRAWEADQLDFDTKRAIIQTLIEKINIGPSVRGRWTTIEERLTEHGGRIVWRA